LNREDLLRRDARMVTIALFRRFLVGI